MTVTRTIRSFKAEIFEKATLLSLNMHSLGIHRRVPKAWVREQLAKKNPLITPEQLDEQVKRIGSSKRLLEAPELDAINDEMRRLYQWCKDRSMPSFFQKAFYFVRKEDAPQFDEEIIKTEMRLKDVLVPAFVAVYADRIAETRDALEPLGLFNEDDFPPVEEVASRFGVDYQWLGINVPKGIPEAVRKQAEDRLEQKFEQIGKELTEALRRMYQELVDYAVATLAPKDGKERVMRADSAAALVARFQQFHETFKSRNLTDDDALDALVAEARKAMKGVTAKDVQQNESMQERLHKALSGIKAEMDKLVVPRPKRKLNLDS